MKQQQQRGLGALAAVVVLVLLALLAATVVRLSSASQSASAQDVQGARAQAALRAGIDWGLYQLFRGTWQGCSSAQSYTLNLTADIGANVTVSCSGTTTYNEGLLSNGSARRVRVIRLMAVACNAASCPDNSAAARPQYVERMRELTVSECTQEPAGASWGACPF